MNRTHIRGLIIAVLLVFLIFCGKSTLPERVSLSGHFATVGNAPFVKLVFRADNGISYEVAPREADTYEGMQGVPLEIEGRVSGIRLKTADGRYTRQIQVISEISVRNGR